MGWVPLTRSFCPQVGPTYARISKVQVTDFWHAAEYLGKAAVVLYRGQPRTKEAWLEGACHRLRHEPGGAQWVLKQLRRLARERPWAKDDEDVQRAITYFANQSGAGRMDYSSRVAANQPIGSGVTEAACKVIVKQRLCGSGMKWTEDGASVVLSLRALSYTPERWSSSGRRSIDGGSPSPPESGPALHRVGLRVSRGQGG